MKFLPTSLICLFCLAGAAQGQTPQVIARSGDSAPDLSGVTYVTGQQTFIAPQISSTGIVTFYGGLAGTGVTASNNLGLFQWINGTASLVARHGDAAPSLSGVTFAQFNNALSGRAGNNAPVINITLAGTGVTTANDTSLWQGSSPSTMTLVAREGDAVPGLGGAVWNTLTNNPLILPDNRHVITGSLVVGTGGVTTANDGIIMIGTTGNLTALVREGEAAPSLAGLTTSGLQIAGINVNGAASVRSTLVGSGVTTSNNSILMAGTAGNMQLLARTGTTPVGFDPSITINGLGVVAPMLANGSSYFSMTLTGTGITTANDGTVWHGSNASNIQLVYREGDQVPGQPINTLFSTVGTPRSSGNRVAVQLTFTGSAVTTSNDQAVMTWTPTGGIEIVAREGTTAPGTGGALYGNFLNSTILGSVASPGVDGDNVLFRAALTGSGVTTGVNDAGIFLRDTTGIVRLVARKGDVLDGSTITELSFAENLFNAPSSNVPLNADGSLSYIASLANGNTVIVVIAVPEPATVLGAVAVIGLVGVRLRRRFAR